MTPRWNHNLHHHPVLLGALPARVASALDAGCGSGALLPELARRADRVVGVDLDAASLEHAARDTAGHDNVELVRADVLTHDFGGQRFDAVLSVATLHHLPLRVGLARLAGLVSPGGTLGVIGIARTRSPLDLVYDGIGFFLTRVLAWRRGRWESPTLVAVDPTTSYRDVRRAVRELLPGARFERHPLFRYTVVWRRPVGA